MNTDSIMKQRLLQKRVNEQRKREKNRKVKQAGSPSEILIIYSVVYLYVCNLSCLL